MINVALGSGDTPVAAAEVDPIAQELFWTDGTHARLLTLSRGVNRCKLRSSSRRALMESIQPKQRASTSGAEAGGDDSEAFIMMARR